MNNTLIIPEWNAVTIVANWRTAAGAPEAPTQVRWQVFDVATGDAIGTAANASGLAATMEIVIPHTALPGPAAPGKRELRIQVSATFAAGDSDTRVVSVKVEKMSVFT